MDLWEKSGITPHITQYSDSYTGAAYIFIEDKTGNNAIIVSPGAAANINDDDITANKELIQGSRVFMTQLEQALGTFIRLQKTKKQCLINLRLKSLIQRLKNTLSIKNQRLSN